MILNTNHPYYSEIYFFSKIESQCNIVFDIGCNNDSIFIGFERERERPTPVVHYFECVPIYIEQLETKLLSINQTYYLNKFGLSNNEEKLPYYSTGSFIDRSKGYSRTPSKYLYDLELKRGDKYVNDNNIINIDFLKIDVEGYELNVFKGFGEKLSIVKYLQFEYGSGVADAGYKMIDMVDYLKKYNFEGFSYLNEDGSLKEITNYNDHWGWCNIVCYNKDFINNWNY